MHFVSEQLIYRQIGEPFGVITVLEKTADLLEEKAVSSNFDVIPKKHYFETSQFPRSEFSEKCGKLVCPEKQHLQITREI